MRGGVRRPGLVAILALALLFLMLGNPSAQTVNCIAGGTTDFGTCISYMVPLALIGILFSLMLVALSYMLGEMLNISNLKGWYRAELRETAKSALLIVIIVASLVILSSIAAILAGTTATTGKPSAIYSNLYGVYGNINSNYLQPQLGTATTAYNELVGLSLGLSAIKSINIETWIPIPIIPPFIFAALQFGSAENLLKSNILESATGAPQSSFIYDAITLLVMPVFLAMQVQADILWSVIQLGLLVFIPIGILLRALPFLRAIGGAMVAIGIALSLVYPAVLVGLNMPVTSFFTSAVPSGYSCGFGSGPVGVVIGILCGILQPVFQAAPPALNFWNSFTVAFQSADSIYPALNLINYYTFPLVVQFILLILELVIIVTMATNIARMLGGSLRLGIGRMKLV